MTNAQTRLSRRPMVESAIIDFCFAASEPAMSLARKPLGQYRTGVALRDDSGLLEVFQCLFRISIHKLRHRNYGETLPAVANLLVLSHSRSSAPGFMAKNVRVGQRQPHYDIYGCVLRSLRVRSNTLASSPVCIQKTLSLFWWRHKLAMCLRSCGMNVVRILCGHLVRLVRMYRLEAGDTRR